MVEQCPYLDGNSSYQCHPSRSLPVARVAIGYEDIPLPIVQLDLCRSEDPSRETSCPAFKDISILGLRSSFARPVNSNH